MDNFICQINNPNQHHYYNGFVSPFVSIQKTEEKKKEDGNYLFHDLFKLFYYNALVNDCRQVIDKQIEMQIDDSFVQITALTQPTFSIKNTANKDGTYPVDYNKFSTFFGPDFLPNKSYLTPRFGCDSFCYISDGVADLLSAKYSIENDPYASLVTEEDYSILHLRTGYSENEFSVSINNIISSGNGSGPRIKELYGQNFILLFLSSQSIEHFNNSIFEVDFKVNQFGNKRILNDIINAGYDTENSSFTFFSFNYSTNQYVQNETIDSLFLDIVNNRHNYFPSYLSYVNMVVGTFLLIVVSIVEAKCSRKTIKIIMIVLTGTLFIAGLIAQFQGIAPIFSLFPIIGYLTILLLNAKEVDMRAFSTIKSDAGQSENERNSIYQIDI